MSIKLEEKNIFLGLSSVTKEEAIKFSGEKLFEAGYVDKKYIEGMLEREKVMTTYMGMGVAIPHGTNEVKKSVKESGIAILQYPNGIEFGSEKAYLLIAIAGKGDDHLEILSNIAINLSDELVERLKDSKEATDFLDAFN